MIGFDNLWNSLLYYFSLKGGNNKKSFPLLFGDFFNILADPDADFAQEFLSNGLSLWFHDAKKVIHF